MNFPLCPDSLSFRVNFYQGQSEKLSAMRRAFILQGFTKYCFDAIISRLERNVNMETKHRNTSLAYYIIQGSYWMSICVASSYAAFYLQSRGYSNSQLGLILATGNVAGFVLSPNLAAVVDRSKRIGIYHCLWGLLLIQGLLLVLFTLIPGKSLTLALLYCVYIAVVVAINPLNTELCFELSRWSKAVSYSPARGIGSLCYALMALALGQLTLRLGAPILPFAGLFCLLCQGLSLMYICLVRNRSNLSDLKHSHELQVRGLSLSAFIIGNRRFCVLMFGIALLFFSYNMADYFLINIARSVGGDTGDLGGISAFKAMMEIPVMLLYTRLTCRFRCSTVMCFSAFAFGAKAAALAMAGSISALYAANLLQALSFALMIPSMVQYVNLVIDPKDSAKGQAIANGMMTLGAVFASLIGGQLYDLLTVKLTLVIGTIIAILGAIICTLAVERKKT